MLVRENRLCFIHELVAPLVLQRIFDVSFAADLRHAFLAANAFQHRFQRCSLPWMFVVACSSRFPFTTL
jgi:hypothetical protein